MSNNASNNASLAAEGGCELEAIVNMNPIVVRLKVGCAAQALIRGVVERDDYVYACGPKLIKLMRKSVLASLL